MSKKTNDVEVQGAEHITDEKVRVVTRGRYKGKSYNPKPYRETGFNRNESMEGESIEEKFERIQANKEPITDGAPLIYTERNKGVLPAYDIRTDRFDVAIDGMDVVHKSHLAKRDSLAKMDVVKDDKDSGAEPIQGTETK